MNSLGHLLQCPLLNIFILFPSVSTEQLIPVLFISIIILTDV